MGARPPLRRRSGSLKSATARAARPSASSAPTSPPTKRITCCRSLPASFCTPTISIMSAPPITRPSPVGWPAIATAPRVCARLPMRPLSCSSAATPRKSIRCLPGSCAPTCASITRSSTSRTQPPSSLSARRAPRCVFLPAATPNLLPISTAPTRRSATRHSAMRFWPKNLFSSSSIPSSPAKSSSHLSNGD